MFRIFDWVYACPERRKYDEKVRPAVYMCGSRPDLDFAGVRPARRTGGLELKIAPVKGGLPLLVLPMEPGERFTLHYYHSVENAPIWEEHSLDEKGPYLY